jgi:hypothetical protein
VKGMISAEVEPISEQADQAALALQRLGFRILHIGSTISVQGPASLWRSIFHVSFKRVKKSIGRDTKAEVTYYKPLAEVVQVPAALRSVIANVIFVEPPEHL